MHNGLVVLANGAASKVAGNSHKDGNGANGDGHGVNGVSGNGNSSGPTSWAGREGEGVYAGRRIRDYAEREGDLIDLY